MTTSENRGPIAFVPSPELYPFTSRWFESSVGPVHYVDEGDGPAILMVHGNPTWSFLYRDIIRDLRSDFRCVAVDLPGFGLSARPDGYGYTPREHAVIVGELVRELDLQNLIVMAQDWGGPIAMSTAASMPDRVRGLVMGNTWYWPNDQLVGKIFSLTLSSPPFQWLITRRNFFVKRMMPMAMRRKLTKEEWAHYSEVQAPGMREGAAVFPREIRKSGPWLAEVEASVKSQLSEKPLLLTWGMKDFAFRPTSFLPRWQRDFPQATLVELGEAKHYIQEDAPEEIAAAIRNTYGSPNG